MKLPVLTTRAVLAILALMPLVSLADETIPGNLTVEQNLLVHQKIEVGDAVVGANVLPCYSLQANSLLGSTHIDQIAYGTSTTWNWSVNDGTTVTQLLRLESNGTLSLYSQASPTVPMIILNAGGTVPELTIAGNKVVTEANIGIILSSSGGNLGQLAIGQNSHTYGYDATALGGSSWAEGFASTAIGYGAYACGDGSTSLGYNSYTDGNWSISSGNNCGVMGDNSAAMGCDVLVRGNYSSAWGNNCNVVGDFSVALGNGAKTSSSYQITLGNYNQILDEAYFIIGNGTGQWYKEDNQMKQRRSNLFIIMKDGRGVFRNTTYVEPTTPTTVQAKEALTVQGAATIDGAATITGDATIKGTLRVRPAGDLPMGIFTAGGQP